MNPVIARMIAAVGVVLSLASLWPPLFKADTTTYWSTSDHGVGIALLALAIVAAVGLLLASVLGRSFFDRVWLLAGTTAGGMFLYAPIAITSSFSASGLRAGAWLGAAAFIFFIIAGALLPHSAAAPARASESPSDEPETGA